MSIDLWFGLGMALMALCGIGMAIIIATGGV